jgi:pimeloyl-ACP methyl ester carboxylesterase
MRAEERSTRVAGVRLHVRDVGVGAPVLLINGLGTHTAMWAPLEEVLVGHFRLIEFDAPGTGQSSTPSCPLTIPALAWLVQGVLDSVGVERADVLGYSIGGLIAQKLAVTAPARVRRLVFVGTSCSWGGVPGRLRPMLNLATPLRYWFPAFYRNSVGNLAGGRARHDPDWVSEQGKLRMLHPPTTQGYLGQVFTVSAWSGLPLLRRIHQPALVVSGGDDPLVPPANALLLARHMSNARALVAHGEGHLLLMDANSAVLEPIREFLAAEELADAPVWREAQAVSAAELREAITAARHQAQPWGVVSAIMRALYPAPSSPLDTSSWDP